MNDERRPSLKYMEKMEEILEYVLNHLEEKLTAEQTAEVFGYHVRAFQQAFCKYFELPFHKYVTKLRLRRAADTLRWRGTLLNCWSDYGYENNSSFCNAFKKEFGVGPGAFFRQERTAPPMPKRKQLFGMPVETREEITRDRTVRGHYYEAKLQGELNLMEETAYALRHPGEASGEALEEEPGQIRYGFWQLLEPVPGSLCYVYGTESPGGELEIGRAHV